MFCERLINLGQFGSVVDYRQIGIRRSPNPDASGNYSWYVTLDGVAKRTGYNDYLKLGRLCPVLSGESNDTCTTMYARAEADAVNKANLAFHVSGGGWTLWPSVGVSRQLYHPTLYSMSAPHAGTPAAACMWGPTSLPSYGC